MKTIFATLTSKRYALFLGLLLLFLVCFILDIAFGKVTIHLSNMIDCFRDSENNTIYREIILNYRLPKAITAILSGGALAVAGLLMQTLFRNPLAGPGVLGVTSGASLGVALLTLGAGALPSFFLNGWGFIIAAIIGAITVLFLVVVVAIKIRQTVSLLIVGMMFGYFAGAIVSILQNQSNPDTLKLFIHWTFGSLSSVNWEQISIMCSIISIGIIITLVIQKKLDTLLLGENNATTLGVSIFKTRLIIIFATACLAATCTAFTGPISFVGITVPHLARGLFKTNQHHILIPASLLCGSILLLICDLLSQFLSTHGALPINAVTAFFGAPLIIWIILKR